MRVPSTEQRKSLVERALTYERQLRGSEAENYLRQRGFDGLDLEKLKAWFQPGFIADPLPEDQSYRGRLVIPYLRWHPKHGSFPVTFRYRTIRDETPKYLSTPGDEPCLFNTQALIKPRDFVGICEGEIDAMTATICGIPTVGVPGAKAWRPDWLTLFAGYRRVYVMTDGDEPGEKLGNQIAAYLPQAVVRPMGSGEDVNSVFVRHGADALKERILID